MRIRVIYEGQKLNPEVVSPVAGGNGGVPSRSALLAAALSALTLNIAIVDAKGLIAAVNDGWRHYADENGMRWSRYGIGYSYLSVLDSAARHGDDSAGQIAAGMRRVLAGQDDSFRVEYACETPDGCYFVQQVTAFEYGGARYAMVSHENISPRGLNEDELRAAKETAEAARREEKIRREVAENRLRNAEAVADMLTIASSGQRLEDALSGMVQCASETLSSQAAAIYSAEERWDHLMLVARCGVLGKTTGKRKSPIAPSILARAIADQRCLALGDAWQEVAHSETEVHGPARQPDYRGLLVTPVQRKDNLYGYLILFYAEPQEFEATDVELAYRFGQQVSLALENAELRRQAEKAAIENERSRLARDLHDAVTQTLFSASAVAEALPRVWERDPVEGRRALEELRLWTRGALAEMRTLLMELRPTALIEKPLPDLIRQLGEAAATRLCIPVVCHITAGAEPPTGVKLSLYRIAQEALNNATKHSHASHVEIHYRALPRGVQLAIVDDGRGFDFDRRTSGQMGLGTMRERAQQIGAELTIRSAPGLGTEVHVEWRRRGRKNLHE